MDQPDRRIELIRARLESYYDVEARGPKKVTWGGICDHIFDLTGVQMDGESLRQFVRRIRRRNRPRVPSTENLEAISSFLCHPDIDMLAPEELEEPEIPFHSIRSLLEFLRHDQDSEISPPPPALAGVYRAIHPSPETSTQINVELTFKVDGRDHVIRLSEVLELYTNAADVDSGTGLYEHNPLSNDRYDTFLSMMLYAFDEMVDLMGPKYWADVVKYQVKVHQKYLREILHKEVPEQESFRSIYGAKLLALVDDAFEEIDNLERSVTPSDLPAPRG